jgi:hypothetical protein
MSSVKFDFSKYNLFFRQKTRVYSRKSISI